MNKEKILKLADYIESTEYSANNDGVEDVGVAFNMSDFVKEGACGTVGCIAGHALIFFKGLKPQRASWLRRHAGHLRRGGGHPGS